MVVYKVVEHEILDPLHKEVIDETRDTHVATLLDINATADRLRWKLLTSSSFMDNGDGCTM